LSRPPASPAFLVAVCQIGAERALKQEVGRDHPGLAAAFARPGLVTFKSLDGPIADDFDLRAVFARAYAVAIGPRDGDGAILAEAAALRGSGAPLRLHVWPRDRRRPGEEPAPGEPPDAAAGEALRERLLLAGAGLFLGGGPAAAGERVLDVIVAPGEPHFVGHHRQGRSPGPHSPFPGGLIPVEVPEGAPSRAYRKIEEAIAWSGARLEAGQVAVEIGSAPGGASMALLRRGLRVVGIDPGAMDERVLRQPGFTHLAMAVGAVERALLPPRADWLLLDVNLAPQVALRQAGRLVAALRPSLRGAFFTLKLNDWATAAKVPTLLARVGELGFSRVRATQLPSNRQEILVFAERTPAPARPPRPARATPAGSGRGGRRG